MAANTPPALRTRRISAKTGSDRVHQRDRPVAEHDVERMVVGEVKFLGDAVVEAHPLPHALAREGEFVFAHVYAA